MIDERTAKTLIVLSQGNIGALNCLIKILESDSEFLNPLGVALLLTKSKSFPLWKIYNDICKKDIDETKKILSAWFDTSHEPLEKWIKKRGKN